jgi:hypothetical protein
VHVSADDTGDSVITVVVGAFVVMDSTGASVTVDDTGDSVITVAVGAFVVVDVTGASVTAVGA